MHIKKALTIDHLHRYGVKVGPESRDMGPQDPRTQRPEIPPKVGRQDPFQNLKVRPQDPLRSLKVGTNTFL